MRQKVDQGIVDAFKDINRRKNLVDEHQPEGVNARKTGMFGVLPGDNKDKFQDVRSAADSSGKQIGMDGRKIARSHDGKVEGDDSPLIDFEERLQQ